MNTNYTHNEEEISLSDIFGILKPYLLHIVLLTVIFAMVSFVFTKTMIDPVYQSSATLIVNNRRDEGQSVTNDELNSARGLASVYSIVIKSNAVMEPVVKNLDSGITMDELSRKITVSSVDNTQVIRISVKDTDKEKAQVYTNEIIKVAPEILVDMVEAGSVKVMSYPQIANSPISPNTKMNVLVAGMLGFMLSVGIVLVRYLMDKTVRSTRDVETYLGVPVLGVIPNYESVRGGK